MPAVTGSVEDALQGANGYHTTVKGKQHPPQEWFGDAEDFDNEKYDTMHQEKSINHRHNLQERIRAFGRSVQGFVTKKKAQLPQRWQDARPFLPASGGRPFLPGEEGGGKLIPRGRA